MIFHSAISTELSCRGKILELDNLSAGDALPNPPAKNAPQIGMFIEHNAEQVECLAFMPVCRAPTAATECTCGFSFVQIVFRIMVCLCTMEERWYTTPSVPLL